MDSCHHNNWLSAAGSNDVSLRDKNRLNQILTEITNPTFQFPSLLFFLGRKTKDHAIQQLFTHNKIEKKHHDRFTTLRKDNSTLETDYPILFADADHHISTDTVVQQKNPRCHEISLHPIRWLSSSRHKLHTVIYMRLFFLFTDVICIFADDVGGLNTVADILKEWAKYGSVSCLPKVLRPRVVIVISSNAVSPTFELLEIEDLRFNLREQGLSDIYDCFSGVSLLHLASDYISPLARYRRLKEALLRQADELRELRISHRYLLSAVHFNDLFHQAIQHTATTYLSPFNFILQSRIYNPIGENISGNISSFLQLGIQSKLSYEALASLIGSSILMDAYPPGMHCMLVNHLLGASSLTLTH